MRAKNKQSRSIFPEILLPKKEKLIKKECSAETGSYTWQECFGFRYFCGFFDESFVKEVAISSQKRGKLLIIMRNRFCNVERGKQIEQVKKKKKQENTRILNNYLGMALISVVVLILLGALTVQSRELKTRIASYDTRASELRTSIEEEEDRKNKAQKKRRNICRRMSILQNLKVHRLGLVKGNEIVFEEEK